MVTTDEIWSLLEDVNDPEVPVLSVVDLGIVREIRTEGEEIEIVITPTYSGCPAMDVIRMNIRMKLREQGYPNLKLTTVLSPAWTTDWLTDTARAKLLELGIAPPEPGQGTEALFGRPAVPCPRCGSRNTERISAFGSTACKALHRCLDCREPFEAFKCH